MQKGPGGGGQFETSQRVNGLCLYEQGGCSTGKDWHGNALSAKAIASIFYGTVNSSVSVILHTEGGVCPDKHVCGVVCCGIAL